MATYIPSNKILQIALIEGETAVCKICGERKQIRGIFSHYFRVHTEAGKKHTEKVKNVLVEHNKKTSKFIHCDSCQNDILIANFSRHKKSCEAHQQLESETIGAACESCGNIIKTLYGSGRFCNIQCSNGKYARPGQDEKNRKISAALSGRILINHDGTPKVITYDCVCRTCDSSFVSKKLVKDFCSGPCRRKSPEHSEKMRKATLKRIERGDQYPRGIKCKFDFCGESIRCDSKHEWICLNWLCSKYDIVNIARPLLWLEYELDNLKRKYNPDFHVVTTTGESFLIEAKMDQAASCSTFTKYVNEATVKKETLKNHCNIAGIKMIWFTQNTDKISYRNISKTFKLNA